MKVPSVGGVHTHTAAVLAGRDTAALETSPLGEELCSGRQQLLKCVFQVLSVRHSLSLEG